MSKITWTNEKIKEEIIKVMKALNIERMPSNSEIKLITKSTALANKISKTGGFYYWADMLGIPIKESETSMGLEYEMLVKRSLENMGYKVDKMQTRHPYDLLANDAIKIDVKVSTYFYGVDESYKSHSFNLGKKSHNCDIFILIGLDDNKNIVKFLVIPSKMLMGIKQVCIGEISKYDKYHNAFEYIAQYNSFYNGLL